MLRSRVQRLEKLLGKRVTEPVVPVVIVKVETREQARFAMEHEGVRINLPAKFADREYLTFDEWRACLPK